jgi:DNA mismatch repair protein PMS2
MATIKAIEGQSVHQIQSGQVIVDLNSVVKELVENSLDAGASSVEIRFKNHGLDSIEVHDNGKGIAPDDYETVALKHHTSKLSNYEDLTSLDTFGFRGEALSSLCALSKFHVITARAEDGAVGKRLDFETSGKLKSATVTAAQKGTTVAVENLFCNLPVRRKELEKNIKREYNKVLELLHAYACISIGVRFSVSNQMPKGKKVAVFSTKGNSTTKENIVNVFGAKTLLALIKFDLHLEISPSSGPSTQGARNWATQATDKSMEVFVEGHISKPVFGEGRQAPDRQMFFVNSRPCKLPQVSKAVNEVYKGFNVSQSPFIFANLVMDTNAYDVNVSPDKRTIMLHDQTALLEKLKASLTELFEQTDHTVPQSTLPQKKLPGFQPLTVPRRQSTQSTTLENGHEASASEGSDSEPETRTSASAVRPIPNGTTTGAPPNLIHDWIGRDTEPRPQAPNRKKYSPVLSKGNIELVKALLEKEAKSAPLVENSDSPVELSSFNSASKDAASAMPTDDKPVQRWKGWDESEVRGVAHNDQQHALESPVEVATDDPPTNEKPPAESDPMSTSYDDLLSQRPAPLPQAVDRVESPAANGQAAGDAPNEANPELMEPPIAAIIPSSQKATPGPIANAFDRMRPKRTPLQTAEITIGNTTTTTVIGSTPAYKRRRIHEPQNSQSIARFGASPLLVKGLKNFAAPGSQMQVDSSDAPLIQFPKPNASVEGSDEESEEDDQETPGQQSAIEQPPRTALPPSDMATSDPLDSLLPALADDDEYDEDYVDENEKRIREDEKVARLIQEAEEAAARPSEENLKRASQVLKNGGNRKEATLQVVQNLNVSMADIEKLAASLFSEMGAFVGSCDQNAERDNVVVKDELDDTQAESKLSLTVSKSDFERMIIIGQFNLGFILAIRPAIDDRDEEELFIIDQHAADEKYNYERLQRTVTLQSQRLVRPKPLELTAVQEEIIDNHPEALKANGFEVETISYTTDDESAGRRCRLLTLPISGEKTFDTSDFEELLHLLSEAPPGSTEIPRPRKVQKILAVRACRSSIMVGKTLTEGQMRKVVRHMGEMEKPWNCPHGRPTMRHLAGLGAWRGWREGEGISEDDVVHGNKTAEGRTDWKGWLARSSA